MRNTLIRPALIRGTATAWTQQPQQQQYAESDSDTTDATDTPDTDASDQTDDTDGDTSKDGKVDWEAKYRETLAHSRKHEAEAKKLRPAASKLEEIEAKNRSAEEKAQKERDDAKAEAEAAKAEAAIERAARKHGLTDDKDLEVLQGLPAEKVEAVAKALAAGKKTAPSAGGSPAGGGKGDQKPKTLGSALAAHYSK